jgi:nicotinamidase-related amidase
VSITTVDSITALLVIDLQKGIVGLPTAHPSADIVARAAELAGTFRRFELPVVLVNVAGAAPGRTNRGGGTGTPPSDWTDLVPGLDRQPSDHTVTKHSWGAFWNTDLDGYLRDSGVTQVVVVGIATSIGVESTARAAYDHGYNVTVLTDAVSDLDEQNHVHSVERVFPMLGETGSTAEFLQVLESTRG